VPAIVILTVQALVPGIARGATPRPDLVVSAVSNPPSGRHPGQRFAMTDTTKNAGAARAAASTTRYSLSLDKRRGSTDIRLAPRRPVKVLAPGNSSRGTVTLRVPSWTPTGSWHVLVCADDTRAVRESNEGNNCRVATKGIRLTPHPLSVVPTLDPSRAVTAEIPDAGGTIQATDANGTKYILAIPFGALLTAQQVTLTPVTSISGTPLGTPTVAGVDVQPSGLVLNTDATLSIVPAVQIPVADQHGFAADGAGHDFHRYPLDPSTSRIAFDITHFSVFDLAKGTVAQVEAVGRDTPASPAAQFESDVAGPVDSYREGRLTNPELADMLNDPAIKDFQDRIAPDAIKAETDDEAINKAVIEMVGWERQLEILGQGDRYRSAFDQINQELLKIAKNAFLRALERCRHGVDPRHQQITMIQMLKLVEGRGADPAQELGSNFWSDMASCKPDYLASGDLSSSGAATTSSGFGFGWSSGSGHGSASAVSLRLGSNGENGGPVFFSGQGSLAVDGLASASEINSCQEGDIKVLGPVSSTQPSILLAKFEPDANLGVPGADGGEGVVSVDFLDYEDVTSQCNDPTLHHAYEVLFNSWRATGFPQVLWYSGSTLSGHLTGTDNVGPFSADWTVDYSITATHVNG
jgi:hypothetical protein